MQENTGRNPDLTNFPIISKTEFALITSLLGHCCWPSKLCSSAPLAGAATVLLLTFLLSSEPAATNTNCQKSCRLELNLLESFLRFSVRESRKSNSLAALLVQCTQSDSCIRFHSTGRGNMSGGSAGLYENFNMRSGGADLASAIVPLLKLLCLTVIGLFLANPRMQFIPRATFRLLSKLVFALFLPCLIFTELGGSITLQNFLEWWFIPVNVLVSTALGCLLGFLVVVICRPPPELTRFTIIMTGFGNTGNLPLALVGSVCHSKDNPFGSHCNSRGVSYVSFSQWVAVILVYTFVYHMMEPPMQYYEIVEEGNEIEEQRLNDISRPLLVEAEWPGIEDKETEHSKTPFIARVFKSISGISSSTVPDLEITAESSGGNSPRSIRCLAEPRVVRRIRIVAEQTPIQHILQPPTIASLLAIFIGMIPQLKALFFGFDAPLLFITDSLEILGGAMVPSVMLVLGGMLAEGPNESKLGLRTTIGIIVARLLVLPLLGIGIVTLSDKLNFLGEPDAMFRFVLLLQYTTPSAILLGAIASLRGYAVSEASALLFWQHIFALFSLSLYIVIYFKIISYI